jgi:[acyl-carrier-protein] S-malonyltransferase
MLNDFVFPQNKDYQLIIDEFDHILNPLIHNKISSLMTVEKNDTEENLKEKRKLLNETKIAQPAILLQSILNYKKFSKENTFYEVCSLFGPSLGEIIALVIGESINYSKGAELLYKRGECMQESCPQGLGAMLNVVGQFTISIEYFHKFLQTLNDEEKEFINISSINSNRLIVLSGKSQLIDRCAKFFKENSIACKKLPVSAAFHSKLMIQGQKLFRDYIFNSGNNSINLIGFNQPKFEILSTIESDFFLNNKQSIDFDFKVKELLVKQFVEPVNLLDCVKKNAEQNIKIHDMNKRKIVDFAEFL